MIIEENKSNDQSGQRTLINDELIDVKEGNDRGNNRHREMTSQQECSADSK